MTKLAEIIKKCPNIVLIYKYIVVPNFHVLEHPPTRNKNMLKSLREDALRHVFITLKIKLISFFSLPEFEMK